MAGIDEKIEIEYQLNLRKTVESGGQLEGEIEYILVLDRDSIDLGKKIPDNVVGDIRLEGNKREFDNYNLEIPISKELYQKFLRVKSKKGSFGIAKLTIDLYSKPYSD